MQEPRLKHRNPVLRAGALLIAIGVVVAVVLIACQRRPGSAHPEASGLPPAFDELLGPRHYCVYGSGDLAFLGPLQQDTPAFSDEQQLRARLKASPRTLVVVIDGASPSTLPPDLHQRSTVQHKGQSLPVYEYRPELSAPPVSIAGRILPEERQANLLVTGDWGDETIAQAEVATSMSLHAARQKPAVDAVLLVGDNFYGSLRGADDPTWQRLFETRFDPVLLPAPFYVVLGNHDYEGDKAEIQLRYAKEKSGTRWRMPARWYRVDLPADRPLVTALMLDSNINELTTKEWEEQRRWLVEQLRAPRQAKWLAVCAHHPLFSRGMHGDNDHLQQEWGELIAAHKVDFYIAGHDHDLQHLQIPGRHTEFLVVGGGGAAARPIDRDGPGPFAAGIHGFTHLRFGEQSMEAAFIDQQGHIRHAFAREDGAPATTTRPATAIGIQK